MSLWTVFKGKGVDKTVFKTVGVKPPLINAAGLHVSQVVYLNDNSLCVSSKKAGFGRERVVIVINVITCSEASPKLNKEKIAISATIYTDIRC